jgi:hypothetical protein
MLEGNIADTLMKMRPLCFADHKGRILEQMFAIDPGY